MPIDDLSPENIQKIEGESGNILEITSEGEAKISSFANVSFVAGDKTVSTTESLASVGVSNLANRKSIKIINRGNKAIYFGPTGLSDSALSDELLSGESVTLAVGDNIDIYYLTKTGTSTVTVWEFA